MTAPTLTRSPELEGFAGILHFAADPLGSLEEARRLHGCFVGYKQALGIEVRLVFEPQLVDDLLVAGADHLIKDEYTRQLKPVLGQGLLTSEGQLWKQQRKLLSPSFQPRHVDGYARVMVARAEALVESFGDGGVRSIHADMMHLTLDVVVRTLFGGSVVRAAEVETLLDRVMADYRTLMMSWRVALPWFPFYSRLRFRRVRRRLRHVVDELISERRRSPLGNDLLSRLLEARDEAGRGMSEEQLLDESLTVLLAGHETTALALGYALDLLARHPGAAALLERELEDILGGRSAESADAARLKYCRAVVKESLRLYPPAWAMGREVVSELRLGGETLAPGTWAILSPWVVHRDPRHFPEPLAFRPERWLNGETDRLPKLAYLPFGAGQRVCIGNYFAELEATLLLATLWGRCTFRLTSDAPLELAPSVTLRPKGPLPMQVTRRR